MDWTYKGKAVKELPDWVAGFVYQITNLHNGKMYIGKKLARFRRSRKPLKGRIKKRRFTVVSDWKDYYGSSNALLEDIEKIGKAKFKRFDDLLLIIKELLDPVSRSFNFI